MRQEFLRSVALVITLYGLLALTTIAGAIL